MVTATTEQTRRLDLEVADLLLVTVDYTEAELLCGLLIGRFDRLKHTQTHIQTDSHQDCLRVGFTNTGQIAGLLNSSYF